MKKQNKLNKKYKKNIKKFSRYLWKFKKFACVALFLQTCLFKITWPPPSQTCTKVKFIERKIIKRNLQKKFKKEIYKKKI